MTATSLDITGGAEVGRPGATARGVVVNLVRAVGFEPTLAAV